MTMKTHSISRKARGRKQRVELTLLPSLQVLLGAVGIASLSLQVVQQTSLTEANQCQKQDHSYANLVSSALFDRTLFREKIGILESRLSTSILLRSLAIRLQEKLSTGTHSTCTAHLVATHDSCTKHLAQIK